MVVQGHTEDDEGERRSTVDFEPLEVEVGYHNVKYNWPWISVMNERFQEVARNYLDIHYLGIDVPARLRPDAVSFVCSSLLVQFN